MRVVALMIGRGGSSLKDKNILPVKGVPLLLWAAAAAHASRYVTDYYVSSDDDRILETAARAGYRPIRRPEYLSSATAQSCDAVRHAVEIIEQGGAPDIVVVQHANVGTITGEQIDTCIDLLLANPHASSVVPAHDKAEYHPMRAKRVAPDGTLTPFVLTIGGVSANRQDLPKALFFDHSFWVLRGRSAIFAPDGQLPWNCMGPVILPFETEGCLDVHSVEDLETTAEWIDAHGVATPAFA
ncbi:MAG: CMP-N-acetylneuraminic acid synthetase [Devosia sp.]|nr:CMP-N-acetylneuraminic acid synthetase [Devosia sp.]